MRSFAWVKQFAQLLGKIHPLIGKSNPIIDMFLDRK